MSDHLTDSHRYAVVENSGHKILPTSLIFGGYNQIDMHSFECLYLLSNPYLHIIEIKRIDLPDTASAEQKFLWLKVDAKTLMVSQLEFRSMDSAGTVEERYFEQGYLKFNEKTGAFIEKYNSAQHPLQRLDPSDLDQRIQEAVASLLTNRERHIRPSLHQQNKSGNAG
jgi:hypothetical protein